MWILRFIPSYLDEPTEIGYLSEEKAEAAARHLLGCKSFKNNLYTIFYKLIQ